MGNFIRAASLGGFETLVRSYGVNPLKILDEIGILPSLLRDPDSFIDYDRYLNLLEKAAKDCQDECFGFKLGSLQNINTIGLIGVYMSRQSTILEALKIAQKYVYLHAEGVVFQTVQYNSNICKLQFVRLSEYSKEVPQKSQLAISLVANILKNLIGSQWHAEKISFTQKLPKNSIRLFQDYFACQVEFLTDEDAIYFPSTFLKYKPYNFNEDVINQIILKQLEAQKRNQIEDYTALIESSIKMLMATGDCNVENIALCMSMHPKKLQRILKKQGITYRNLLENVRKKEAVRMLNSANVSLTDIALQLGYAELSIFSRNFKKWFGTTPTDLKEKNE